MSYQEYAHLSRSLQQRRNNNPPGPPAPPRLRTEGLGRPNPDQAATSASASASADRPDRPYTGSIASFSVPRKTPNHSTSSSTSSASLSPSNSASQKAANHHHAGTGTLSPTSTSQWSDRSTPHPKLDLPGGAIPDAKPPNLIDLPLPFRPFYLQRKILSAFAVAFAGLAVCLEALLAFSRRNDGLEVSTAGHYLWRLAVTGLLVLLAAGWGRVGYQAKMAAPWVRLASQGERGVERTLLVDYVGMTNLGSVVKAVGNRDWVVVTTGVVGSFLQLLVVVSTGLMYLALVDTASRAVPVTLTTGFVTNGSGLANAGPLAFYTMLGLQQEDLLFPDGVSTTFAYQQFVTGGNLPAGSVVRATVDGLSAGLECEVARLVLGGVQSNTDAQQFNTSFVTSACNVTMPVAGANFLRPATSPANQTLYFARFGQGRCGNSTSIADQRVVVVFGTETLNPRPLPNNSASGNLSVNGTISRSASLICKPTYSVSRIDVTKKDGLLVSIDRAAEGQDRALANVQAWGIADAFFASFRNELAETYADTTPWFYQPGVVNVDAIMHLALDFRFRTAGIPIAPDALLDPAILQDVVGDYFQQYVPLLASRALMHPASMQATATAALSDERLMVSFAVTQFIATHLAVATFLTVAAILLVPRKGFLPRDPGTIMDTAALIANSRSLLQTLRGTGGGDEALLRERLLGGEFYSGVEPYERADSAAGKGYFKIFSTHATPETPPSYVEPTDRFPHPTLLHPILRLAGLLVTIGIIIGLDFTLQASFKNGGFDDVSDGDTRHLLWTVLPAAILAYLALYFIQAGFALRVLAPYAALIRGAPFEQTIALNLVDKSAPMVIYEAARSRNLAVGGSSVAAFLSALFALFAATLFTAATVPTTASCELVTRDQFVQVGINDTGFCSTCQNGTVLASLVLNGNVSDPGFTYGDLAFPALSLAGVPEGMRDLPDDVIVSATIPAVRPNLACQSFQQSEVVLNVAASPQAGFTGSGNPMRVTLPAAAGGLTVEDNTITINTGYTADDINVGRPPLDPNAFFGVGTYKPVATSNGTLSRWIWVWGQFQRAGTNQTTVRSLSALTCNETMQQLNVAVRFVGPALDIDQSNPPTPDDSSVITVPIAIDGTLNYADLISLDTPHLLDPFFTSLVSSRLAIPLSDLSSPTISDAITRQHRLVRIQSVSALSRRPLPDSDSSGEPFPARLTVNSLTSGAARRIVQDMPTTRILQALLAAVLVASAASWLALPKANLLPRSPTSIASLASLLADGNIFGLLGRGAEWQSTRDLHAYFRDGLHVTMGFHLAWEKPSRRRRDYGSGGEVFAIGAMRTGGWGGGEAVGLGLQARVGFAHREHVRDWGWRT